MADKTYGASDFPVSATASSGLQVSFESDTTGVCTVAGNTVHIVSTGVCTITASQSGNGNYNAATAVKQSFSIGKANQATLTVTSPDSGSYGDVLPIATSGGTTNGALSFQASGTACEIVTSGADAGKLVITSGTGTCSVTATKAADGNYQSATSAPQLVAINKAVLNVNADNNSKTYGEANPTNLGWTYGGFVKGDASNNVTISGQANCTIDASAGPGIGTYADAITCAPGNLSSGNYSFATGQKGTLTITARPITVSADAKSKVYGADDPALTYQITNGSLANGDTPAGVFSGSLTRDAGETVAGSPYAITKGTLAANSNYNLTFNGANLTITARAITVTPDANQSKVYGANDPALTYSLTNGALANGDTLSGILSGSLTRDAGESIGSYTITRGTLAGNNNYTLRFNTGTLKIVYKFSLFLQPINDTAHDLSNNPDVSTFKAGSTVPVKFQLKDANGNVVQSATAPQWLTPQKGSATTQAVDETVFTDPVTSGSTYKYDAMAQQYIYNWGTKGMAAGYYYKIGVKLDDGQTYYTYISLR